MYLGIAGRLLRVLPEFLGHDDDDSSIRPQLFEIFKRRSNLVAAATGVYA